MMRLRNASVTGSVRLAIPNMARKLLIGYLILNRLAVSAPNSYRSADSKQVHHHPANQISLII
jgi:hypothetical protein